MHYATREVAVMQALSESCLTQNAGVAQLAERHVGIMEAVSSNLAISSYGSVAAQTGDAVFRGCEMATVVSLS